MDPIVMAESHDSTDILSTPPTAGLAPPTVALEAPGKPEADMSPALQTDGLSVDDQIRLVELDKRCKMLERQLAASEQKAARAEQTKVALMESFAASKENATLTDYVATINKLQADLTASEARVHLLEPVAARVESLRKMNADLQAELDNEFSRHATSNTDMYTQHEKEVSDLKLQLETTRSQLTSETIVHEELREHYVQMEKNLKDARVRLSLADADKLAVVEKFEAQITADAAELARAQEALTQTTTLAEKLKEQNNTLQRELDTEFARSAQATRELLVTHEAALSALRTQQEGDANELQRVREDNRRYVEAAEGDPAEQIQARVILERQLEGATITIARLEGELEALRTGTGDSAQMASDGVMAAARKVQEEHKLSLAKIEELNGKLERSRLQNKELQEEVDGGYQRLAETQAVLLKEIDSLTKNLASKERELEQWRPPVPPESVKSLKA